MHASVVGQPSLEQIAQLTEQQDTYVEQFYEDLHPGPNEFWKEQLMMLFSAITTMLGMTR